jgi:hypothetical protein
LPLTAISCCKLPHSARFDGLVFRALFRVEIRCR